MIATSLSLAPAPLMQTPPLESGGSAALPFGVVLAALSAPIAAPAVPAIDSLLPGDGVPELASSPPPPVDMTPPGALVAPPVLRRTMILPAGDDMPASEGSDEPIPGSDDADPRDTTGETVDVQAQSIAAPPPVQIVAAAPLPVAEPTAGATAVDDTSIVAASFTHRSAQPAGAVLSDLAVDRTVQWPASAAGIGGVREVGSSTRTGTDGDPAARAAIDAAPPPQADARPLSQQSPAVPLNQNGLPERNAAPSGRLPAASFAPAPQAVVANQPNSVRMAAAIPVRTAESADDLSPSDMPRDAVSAPPAIVSVPLSTRSAAGESPAREMAVAGEAAPAPAMATGRSDAASVAGSMLSAPASAPGTPDEPLTAGQTSAARQAPSVPDQSVAASVEAADVARAAPVSIADRVSTAPAVRADTITDVQTQPADDNDIVATTGIDLNAIFPAGGDAPLTVAFVRPPAARAVADRTGKAGDPTTPTERPAAIDKAAAALPTPTIDAGVIAAAVPATPAHVSVAHGDGAAAPGSGAAAEVVVQHHLDVAHDSAWLDRLARDIAFSADKDMRMRFQLNPERLGSLHVEIAQVADGASVRFRADSEAARALIADAQPMLVAEARAHGMRIAETQVEVGSRNVSTGSAQQGGTDGGFGQQPHQHGQTPPRSFDRATAVTTRSTPGQPAASAARAERYA